MLWAFGENDKKIEAAPGKEGICPLCQGKVFSKCGEINVWHWAHVTVDNCDSWHETETPWHLKWKMTFGKENTEVIIKKNHKRHRADIKTKGGVVIELQNSPIQKSVIREREEFYGERMLWLINGIGFKENFQITDHNLNVEYINRHFQIIHENKNEEQQKYFYWKYARKSWRDVKRYVFIDFGEATLFWVTDGMGTQSGNGIYVSKEDFILKYGGDFKYHCQQFTKKLEKKKLLPTKVAVEKQIDIFCI